MMAVSAGGLGKGKPTVTDQMTHAAFYGRDGLRLGNLPYITVCQEYDRDDMTGGPQPTAAIRIDNRTTAQALDEIARRWNSRDRMLEALRHLADEIADSRQRGTSTAILTIWELTARAAIAQATEQER
jgi:hypothetical protein